MHAPLTARAADVQHPHACSHHSTQCWGPNAPCVHSLQHAGGRCSTPCMHPMQHTWRRRSTPCMHPLRRTCCSPCSTRAAPRACRVEVQYPPCMHPTQHTQWGSGTPCMHPTEDTRRRCSTPCMHPLQHTQCAPGTPCSTHGGGAAPHARTHAALTLLPMHAPHAVHMEEVQHPTYAPHTAHMEGAQHPMHAPTQH